MGSVAWSALAPAGPEGRCRSVPRALDGDGDLAVHGRTLTELWDLAGDHVGGLRRWRGVELKADALEFDSRLVQGQPLKFRYRPHEDGDDRGAGRRRLVGSRVL
jgi:hypothetical protein